MNVSTGVPNLKNIKYDCFLTDTATTKTNFTYDNTNKLYYQKFGDSNGTLIFQTSSLPTIADAIFTSNYLLGASYLSETTHCDFTSGSLPVGWTSGGSNSHPSGSHSETWDANNDEIDLVATETYSQNAKAYISYSAGVGDGVVKAAFRNFGFTEGSYTLVFHYTLYVGNDWIRITDNDGAFTITDSEGGSAGISEPSLAWLKITRSGTFIKTEYSLTGDSGYTTLTNSVTGGSGGTGTRMEVEYATGGGANARSASASVFNFTVYTTPSYVNTLTTSISADGTNYEEVTDATIHRFTNTGTNLFIKFEIDRVDTAAVDKISEYAIWYNCGGA